MKKSLTRVRKKGWGAFHGRHTECEVLTKHLTVYKFSNFRASREHIDYLATSSFIFFFFLSVPLFSMRNLRLSEEECLSQSIAEN